RFQREGNLSRGALLGSLEDHVLEQVRHAHLVARLVPAGRTHPDPRRRGPDATEAFGHDDEAVGDIGAVEGVVQLDGAHRWRAHSLGRSAFRDSRMRPRSSTSSSFTLTISPFLTTSSVFSTRL